MATYTAKTQKELRTEGGSLSKKLGTELGLIASAITGVDLGGSTTGLSIATAKTTGISITPAAATTVAIAIGTSISDGMPMTGTKNGLIRAFGQIKAAETLSNDIRGAWARVRVDASCNVSGGYQVCGVQGSTKMYGSTGDGTTSTLWSHAGVYGSFESDGVKCNVASTGRIAGVIGIAGMGNNFTIDSGAVAAAVMALSLANSGVTATGTFAGVHIAVDGSSKAFSIGLNIADSAATTGINIGNTTGAAIIFGDGSSNGAVEGGFWYNSTSKVFQYYNGSAIKDISTN